MSSQFAEKLQNGRNEESGAEAPVSAQPRDFKRTAWDTNIVDRFVYLVTPLILLPCAVMVLLIARPLQPGEKTIACSMPSHFSSSDAAYGREKCLRGPSQLYNALYEGEIGAGLDQFNESNLIDIDSVFPTTDDFKQSSNRLSICLFALAALCLVPLLVWRSIGGDFDAAHFIINSSPGVGNGIFVTLWYLMMRIGPVVVCVLLFLSINSAQKEAEDYVNALSENRLSKDVSLLCKYKVPRLGGNVATYAVACSIHIETPQSYSILFGEDLLYPIFESLAIWMLGLLIVAVLNAVLVVIQAAMCSSQSYRLSFIKRNVGKQPEKIYKKMDKALGTSGVLVAVLASKAGQAHNVASLLKEVALAED